MRQIGMASLCGCVAVLALMLLCGAFYPNAYIGRVWIDTMAGNVSDASSSFYLILSLCLVLSVSAIIGDKAA